MTKQAVILFYSISGWGSELADLASGYEDGGVFSVFLTNRFLRRW